MKQFDVFLALDGEFYCILQNDLLYDLNSVTTAMLVDPSKDPTSRLTPIVTVEGRRYMLDIPRQIPLRRNVLNRAKHVTSLTDRRDDILDALNLLYWGL